MNKKIKKEPESPKEISENPVFCYYAEYASSEYYKYFYEDIKKEDIEKEDIEKEDIEKEDIEKEDIENIDYTPLLPLMMGEQNPELLEKDESIDITNYQEHLIDKDLNENLNENQKKAIKKALNENQKKAIENALVSPLSIIDGPPGTGKTKVIVNLMSCIVGLGKTVAMVSFNNSAVDNVKDIIEGFKELKDEPENSNKNNLYKKFAPLGKKSKREAFYESDKGQKILNKISIYKEKFSVHYKYPYSKEFLNNFPAISSTIHSLRNLFEDSNKCLFDYVIMDESSQTRPDLGIIAASCAKHLILVGDEHQLPSFCDSEKLENKNVKEAESKIDNTFKMRIEENGQYKDNSFFDIAHKIVNDANKDNELSIMLNEHYRCHPGIIGFCKEEIYDEKKIYGKKEIYVKEMIIRTSEDDYIKNFDIKDKDACPIRVRYYNGDYDERCFIKNKDGELIKESKHNKRQLDVLKSEEFNSIFEKFLKDKSVCILTPYRGQLQDIKEALIEECNDRIEKATKSEDKEKLEELRNNLKSDTKNEEDEKSEKEIENSRIALTIHKSQGQEYDTVYLLPVEDGNWEWPWSQGKHLINVAVSRAKNELIVITSTALMSEDLQKKLRIDCPVSTRKAKKSQEGNEDKNAYLYLRKLLDYVWKKKEKNETEGYGFIYSDFESIFDEKPLIQEWIEEISSKNKKGYYKNNTIPKGDGEESISADELAAYYAFRNLLDKLNHGEKNYKIWYEVQLKSLFQIYIEKYKEVNNKEVLDNISDEDIQKSEEYKKSAFTKDELTKYIEHDNTRCDFVILDNENIVQCVIEIQGTPHRHIDKFDPNFEDKSMEKRYKHVIENQQRDAMKSFFVKNILAKYRTLSWATNPQYIKKETGFLESILRRDVRKKIIAGDLYSSTETEAMEGAYERYCGWKKIKRKKYNS